MQAHKDELEYILSRSKRARITDYAIGATMLAILLAVAMIIIPVVPSALRNSPIQISEIIVHTPMPVCPGDTIEFTSRANITEPSIIGYWTGILNVEENKIVDSSRTEGVPVVRNTTGEIEEYIIFEVPELESGDYVRIAAFSALNSDTRPTFALVNFTVSENCEEGQ